ncbi:MAG: prepilin-type N-terminal cleavage/methylation domain-containing protein [Vulcanimicrobiota bacterium]
MMNLRKVKNKGFSLIEVLIAMLIFTVGVLAIIGLFPTIGRLNKGSELSNQALMLAQARMDQITTNNALISTTATIANPKELPAGATLRWWGESDPNGNSAMQQVKVEVTWVENGRSRKITLTSIISP